MWQQSYHIVSVVVILKEHTARTSELCSQYYFTCTLIKQFSTIITMLQYFSAGIGRTGTLIALDRLIKEGQNESSVDVFKCVNSMREHRVKMVQTLVNKRSYFK